MVSVETTLEGGKRYRVSFHGEHAINVQSVYRRKRRSADQYRTLWTNGMGEPSPTVACAIRSAREDMARKYA